jgi:hypothetical protein
MKHCHECGHFAVFFSLQDGPRTFCTVKCFGAWLTRLNATQEAKKARRAEDKSLQLAQYA